MKFYYGVEKGGSVNHLEFYGVENFRCNCTLCLNSPCVHTRLNSEVLSVD